MSLDVDAFNATADFKMRIFNADGSEAKMCGNGIRCVGKYLFDKGYTTKKNLKIETLSGIKTLSLSVKDGKVREVSVHMGKAVVGVEKVLTVCGQALRCIPVSVGNPHCVVFTENAEEAPLTTVGAALEKHPAFEGGVNAEFVQFIGNNELRMRGFNVDVGVVPVVKKGEDGRQRRANLEVDFICNLGSRRYYIQSSYRMESEEKLKQERASLLRVGDSFKKIIILGEECPVTRDESGITTIGIYDFLLKDNSLEL